MASAVSAYLAPGPRAHLAPPASHQFSYSYCELPGDSIESRRRRLVAGCSDRRAVTAQPPAREQPVWKLFRDPPPHTIREGVKSLGSRESGRESVAGGAKRRGEDAAHAQVQPRSDVECGRGKVQEVRRRFECGASVSFSRSFESPPRRRLADSLFASLKLPRRRLAETKPAGAGSTMESGSMSSQSRAAPREHKRKSAVELLAETKAFYVKSETVLDRKQELPLRVSSGLGQAIAAGGCVPVSSTAVNSAVCCQPYGGCSRRGAADGLQLTLRRLLHHSDSRENVHWQPAYSGPHKARLQHAGTLPPPQKHRSHVDTAPLDLVTAYSIPGGVSSPQRVSLPAPMSPLENDVIEDLGAISPPAQYALSTRERYVRSNSQSAASVRRDSCEESDININSHKSLPDLHIHARCYNDNVSTSGPETIGRSPRRRRSSAHQRTASCSSKGTRSNHSSLVSSCEAFSEHPSPGEENFTYNRCGSSFARDSGGSSGHYTQRSAPPAQRDKRHRTDSNSSGRHSHNKSHYASLGYDELTEWPMAPLQFQDGAPSPPQCHHYADTRVSIYLEASVPPPQFQDDPLPRESPGDCPPPPPRCRPPAPEFTRFEASPEDHARKSLVYAEPRVVRPSVDSGAEYVNTAQAQGTGEDVTSPLGTFKRQRGLRYKQRRPRVILRSKSDICDSRYRRVEGRSASSAPPDEDSPDSAEESSKLHHFFQHLGLDQRTFETVINSSPTKTDSPVFFSDVSTVDSNQMTLATDYTVQGPPQAKPIYRNAEPPSVVERNARIIKWLCNCRKMQLT